MMRPRKWVTFDAFGTLFSPKHPIHETYARIAQRHGYSIDPTSLKSSIRDGAIPPRSRELTCSIRGAIKEGTTIWIYQRFEAGTEFSLSRLVVIKSSFLANGISVCEPFCHELYYHYSSSDAYSLYPDVIPCLRRLHAANTIIGVISDFDERLEGIINGLGLGKYFQFIVQSYVEGYSKPSRELWKVALQKAGQVEKGWHIGDDPRKDAFEDAIPIILDREGIIETSFTRIRTLDELPKFLDVE